MLAEIETAVIARLAETAREVRYADIPRGLAPSLPSPCYMLAISKGAATCPTIGAFKQQVDFSLWVRMSNVQNDSKRRQGAFPVLEAIAQFLFLETLDLDIAPISYKGFTDISTQEEWQSRVAVFQMDFTTSYTTRKVSDKSAADLLTLGLSVLSDGEVRLQDEVDKP